MIVTDSLESSENSWDILGSESKPEHQPGEESIHYGDLQWQILRACLGFDTFFCSICQIKFSMTLGHQNVDIFIDITFPS